MQGVRGGECFLCRSLRNVVVMRRLVKRKQATNTNKGGGGTGALTAREINYSLHFSVFYLI